MELVLMYTWMLDGVEQLHLVVLSSVATYAAILLYTRLAGLRSFSKMSAADFAMTVAVGSLFGATISAPSPSLVVGLTALAMLFACQSLFSWLRRKTPGFSAMAENSPLLLMAGSEIIDENLKKANVTKSDVFAKLREANALNYDDVIAVVFESTGDISVLHSADPDATLEPDFLQGVVGAGEIEKDARPSE